MVIFACDYYHSTSLIIIGLRIRKGIELGYLSVSFIRYVAQLVLVSIAARLVDCISVRMNYCVKIKFCEIIS